MIDSVFVEFREAGWSLPGGLSGCQCQAQAYMQLSLCVRVQHRCKIQLKAGGYLALGFNTYSRRVGQA
jgi:hypothetical protein